MNPRPPHRFPRASLLLLGLLVVLGCGREPAGGDTLVLHGGTIHTLADGSAATVEAIALRDAEVVAVGSLEEVRASIDGPVRLVDLQGATVIPGLVDAHAHLQGLGEMLASVDLRDTGSAAECVERARAVESELAEGEWLFGRAWDQNDWDVKEFPTRDLLDEAFGDRPVVFTRVDGHAAWVNSAALEVAGIDADTPDPEGGEILRDPATGEPTGILVDTAENLVLEHAPEPGPEEIERRYRLAVEDAVRHGLTGVHDMGVGLDELEVLRRGEREGWLDLRTVVYLAGDPTLQAFEGGPDAADPTDRVRVVGVKLYADGALGSRGAALLEDYSDRPGHRGLLIQDPDVLQDHVENAFFRDFGVAVHAIGDRANRIVLDRIVAAHAAVVAERSDLPPLEVLRPRIEHAQVVHPEDLPRFAAHGILPSMQPTHCTSDMPWAPRRLGEDRLEGAYAWRTLRDLGCIVPLGSDFPVERVSPWLGLYAATTRQQPDGMPPGGWSPEQRLTPLEALLGFTRWAAAAIDEPAWGHLGVGGRADLVVVDRDPLEGAAADLLDTGVRLTMVDGEVVYRDPDWSVSGLETSTP